MTYNYAMIAAFVFGPPLVLGGIAVWLARVPFVFWLAVLIAAFAIFNAGFWVAAWRGEDNPVDRVFLELFVWTAAIWAAGLAAAVLLAARRRGRVVVR